MAQVDKYPAAKEKKPERKGEPPLLPQAPVLLGEEKVTERGDGSRVKTFSVRPADSTVGDTHSSIVTGFAAAGSRPAKTYPFELDMFQEAAIGYIEKGESVLVSAHTSAGKTAVAEYAIAKSLRDGQRVIYTSPIKALSNQKYRDLQAEFSDVGLMTGDITINPTASCLIMTTEILRSMLYRGSEVMREVVWVIYDEIHYMRDKTRGVVWEESIILLPHTIRFVFLSATIPNSREFASWIVHLHRQPCHVVYTDYRPVPLEHFVFPSGGEGLHMVKNQKGKFLEDNFDKAMSAIEDVINEPKSGEGGGGQGNSKRGSGKVGRDLAQEKQIGSDIKRIVKLVAKKEFDPCIIFSFSKKDCEAYALQLSKMNLNDEEEANLVEQVFNNAMDSLADEDRSLPQVEAIQPHLKRGIAFHHGGLLPILKEVIEILFGEGLIKILFATETFSIGLNMPARTVVFTMCRKFDGKDFRWLTSGEYIQMSGRAGRRGKDDKGLVIQMMDETMDPVVAKGILFGDPDPLHSSYHISYNMLLNMLRVEGANPEFILRSSFHQYQQSQNAPALDKQAEELESRVGGIKVDGENELREWYAMDQQLNKLNGDVRSVIIKPEHCIPFIQVGRLVRVGKRSEDETKDWGWGTVINRHKKSVKGKGGKKAVVGDEVEHTVECMLMAKQKPTTVASKNGASRTASGESSTWDLVPASPDDEGAEFQVVTIPLDSLHTLSAVKIHMPKDLRQPLNRAAVWRSVKEIQNRFSNSGGIPLLDPVEDMGIRDKSFLKALERIEDLNKRIKALPLQSSEDKETRMRLFSRKLELSEEARAIRLESKCIQHVALKDDLRRMLRVLKRLGHCDSKGVIQLKGRAACEVNTCDELLVTELMFTGVFNDMQEEYVAALLSCLVHGEKGKEGGGTQKLPDSLMGPFRALQDAARKVADVLVDSNLDVNVEEYVATYNSEMMEACCAWCGGAKFIEVMKLTDAFEGTVIRVIRRLEELLRQLASAATSIGNIELRVKFESAATKIRRDIVFAGRLYL